MRIEGELGEIGTSAGPQTNSRPRSTVPARLKAFITATALERQFREPGNPFSSEIELRIYLRLTDLTSTLEERSLSVEIVTTLGLVGRALRLSHGRMRHADSRPSKSSICTHFPYCD